MCKIAAAHSQNDSIPLMDHWYRFTIWTLERTEKFPKSARFTVSSRIDNLVLDGIGLIIEARYVKNRSEILREFNILLEKLRFFIRLAYNRKYLSSGNYREAVEQLLEAGRMTGGWLKFCDSSNGEK